MSGPLAGVRVIELASIGPGPFAGMMLADMGAQITRIDRIERGAGGADPGGIGALLRNDSAVDRGRRSVAVDLKSPRGVDAVLRLVDAADVLIEGFRPGVTEKLGLGPDVCHARNPKLVYGRMTGWGQSGPLSSAAGHDLNYIAVSGALHAMGERGRPPSPPLNLVGDYGGGGMLLALGVVAALFEAARSGRGQVVDAAMSDGAALLMAMPYALLAKGLWRDERESNFLDGAAPFYGTYACADGGFVAVGPIEPQFHARFLGLCGLAGDPLFEKQWDRAAWPRMKAALAAMFLTRTRDAWCALLEGSEACFAPVLTMSEAPHHPHNAARGTFVDAAGGLQPAPAPRFDRTPSVLPRPAPRAGDDSVSLLREAGFDAAAIDALCADGVVFQNPKDDPR